jgi:hypothetical protein
MSKNIHNKIALIVISTVLFSIDTLSVEIKTGQQELEEEKSLINYKTKIEDLLNSNDTLNHVKEESPLLDRRICKFPDLLEKLISKGIDVDVKGYLNQTALFLAIQQRNLRCVSILLRGGTDPNYNPNGFIAHQSPLDKAISDGQLEIVNELLKFGADARVQNEDGETLIMRALSSGINPLGLRGNRLALIKSLITYGADPSEKNVDGLDSLQFARARYSACRNSFILSSESSSLKQAINYLRALVPSFESTVFEALSNFGIEDGKCPICIEEFRI